MTLRYVHLLTDHKQRAVSVLERVDNEVPSKFPHMAANGYWKALIKY